jgi:hypothetical protein
VGGVFGERDMHHADAVCQAVKSTDQ